MKWIDVNEKFPLSDTYILVLLCGKFPKVSYYFQDSFGKWFSTDYDIWDKVYTDEVTHWMPLPKPPPKKPVEPTTNSAEDELDLMNVKPKDRFLSF